MKQSKQYRTRKDSFNDVLTLYGRKPVMEALQNTDVRVFRLHIARETASSPAIREIVSLAEERDVEVKRHTRQYLSRISGNSRQDQGVAIDTLPPGYKQLDALPTDSENLELMALDGITNPQNLGMIIRSVTASPLAGLILPRAGCARLDGLVIKATAGTLFQSNIYHCENLLAGLNYLEDSGIEIIGLSSRAPWNIMEIGGPGRRIVIVGNETRGLSPEVESRCHRLAHIPLGNQVESLNVAAAAAVVAFRSLYRQR